MMILVQNPKKTMHHVFMQKPGESLHKKEGAEHDKDVGGDLHVTKLHFPNV